MKLIKSCIVILMAMIIISCNKAKNSSANSRNLVQDVELSELKQESKSENQNNTNLSADTDAKPVPPLPQRDSLVLNNGSHASMQDWDKKIIKTADVRLELKDYTSYNTSIHKNLKNYGAYIAAEEQNQNEDVIENKISIKVPVDRFEDMMNSFSAEGIKVLQKKINTEDVTGEVVDTKGRIEAKKQARDKYLQLLKNAKNMKEILEVQNEINSLEEDLESAGGRVNHLVHEAAYSTINLTYFQTLNANNYNSKPTFIFKLSEAFKNGGVVLSEFLLFFVTIWPVLLLVLGAWFLIKKVRSVTVKNVKKV